MGIHTNHNPPVAVAAAAATTVAAAVAGKVTKDLGRFRPAKDLGRRVGRALHKTTQDLGWVRPGQVWLGGA